MVRKYFTGRRSGGMREVPVSRGFLGNFRKRFTLDFGEPITIAATGRTGRTLPRPVAAPARTSGKQSIQNGMSGDRKNPPGKALPAWNEGVGEHVRTRSHRPSGNWTVGPKKLRTAVGFAPNEENLFLLPDRP